jgi:hypothetical protein
MRHSYVSPLYYPKYFVDRCCCCHSLSVSHYKCLLPRNHLFVTDAESEPSAFSANDISAANGEEIHVQALHWNDTGERFNYWCLRSMIVGVEKES